MRELRWQILIALGGLVLVIGLLLGQSPTVQEAGPQPAVGGAYTEALIGEIVRLNPILDSANQVDQDIDRLIYSGLVRFNDRGLPIPDLAESIAVSADASLYTVTLREDATWHDGTPVSSADVIFTFSKFQDVDYPGPADLQEFWSEITINRLDERTVQFSLPESFAPFLDYLAVGLLPDHLLRGASFRDLIEHPFNLEPVGTGPFRFDRFLVDGDEIVGVSLTAFEDYFGQRPFIQRFEFRTYPDSISAYRAYQAGEVQGIGTIDESILASVLDDPGLNLYAARLPEIGAVFLNLTDPDLEFMSEKTFRRALLLAINRQWLVDQVFGGQALIAEGPILPGSWAAANDLGRTPYDPAQAELLLADLGWEVPVGAARGTDEYVRSRDEVLLTFELVHADDPVSEAVADILVESWEAIGVRVERISIPAADLLEDYLEPRTFQAVLTKLDLSPYPDPDPYPFWHDSQSETGQNYAGFSDRNISIWLETARINPDFTRRADLYRNFQFRFQDQTPALLLYHPIYNYAISADVQAVSLGPIFAPSDRFATVTEWHLVTRRAISGNAASTEAP